MKRISGALASLVAAAWCAACAGETGESAEYRSFSLVEDVDDLVLLENVAMNSRVLGRFQTAARYRGFTFEATAGQDLRVELDALAETTGILADPIETQILVYGPVANPSAQAFTEVVADSGMMMHPAVATTLARPGHYLIAITRPVAVPTAQFDMSIACRNCQQPPQNGRVCRPGTLYVEGSQLATQEWRDCDVVLLEPTVLPVGNTLTIAADVRVRAHYYITDWHALGWGETALTIDGSLVMESRPEHEIFFRSNVPGKQWVGITVNAPNARLHDFVLEDTTEGLRVRGSGAVIERAKFFRNAVAFRPEADDIRLEGGRFLENRAGVLGQTNRSSELRNFVVRNFEFATNEAPFDVTRTRGLVVEDVLVHHNDAGLVIRNGANVQQTIGPEEIALIRRATVRHNTFGVDLWGNGVLDASLIEQNETYGIRTMGGWHKIKNSLFRWNSARCEPLATANILALANCGAAIIAEPESHTVVRNSEIVQNRRHGLILRGQASDSQANVRQDPAVLNSVIAGNQGDGIVLLDAPIVSIEFNVIENNLGAPFQLAHSAFSTVWNQSRCYATYDTALRTNVQRGCRLREHRIERNNIQSNGVIVRAVHYGFPGTQLLIDGRLSFGPNYHSGSSATNVAENIQLLSEDLVLETLARAEPQAGLVVDE